MSFITAIKKSRLTVALGVIALVAMMGAGELLNLATQVKGVLPAANGGTGLADPGTLANVLTSDGAGHWTSEVPSGGGGSISLRTNGTLNGSQAVLNLEAVGAAFADNGSGTVTLTVTGAGEVADNNVTVNPGAIAAWPACSSTHPRTTAGATADSLTTAGFRTNPAGVTGWQDATVRLVIFQGSGLFTWKVCNNTTSAITPGSIAFNFRTSL